MCLRSPSAVTGVTLGIGDIKESFYIVGKVQAEKDALEISVMGRESSGQIKAFPDAIRDGIRSNRFESVHLRHINLISFTLVFLISFPRSQRY